MKLLVTGACGFVGSNVARFLLESNPGLEIVGFDNLVRPGAETNREVLVQRGIRFVHGDMRAASDIDALPACDWVLDAAAQPSVLAGVDGKSSPRQLYEHNLSGTLNLLEYCRKHRAGLILLSTSRVYSIPSLASLPMQVHNHSFVLDAPKVRETGVSGQGVAESFSTKAPISLYGATKLASEAMAVEAGLTFDFPVWINRCGVLAGAGQFGTAEQGIFSYWLHAYAKRRPLRYIGFGGNGYQARDAFHPYDLAKLVTIQLTKQCPSDPVFNVGGGVANTMSLAQLTEWCQTQFGNHEVAKDERPRPFDIPWFVMDGSRAQRELGWQPERTLQSILDEIAEHVRLNPDWLNRCGAA